MISLNKRVLKNASYLSLMEVVNLITPFIALPYIISTIGLNNYGKIAYVRSIVAIIILIVNWGIDTYIIRDVSMNRNDKRELGRVILSVTIIKTFLAVLCVSIFAVISHYVIFFQGEKLLIVCCLTDLITHIFVPVWFFQGIEKMGYLTVFKFISLSLYLLLIFLFLHSESDYWLIPLFQNIGVSITSVVAIYIIFFKEKVQLAIPTIRYVKDIFIRSFPFFVSRAVNTLNSYIAKIVAGTCLTMETVSFLDIGQKIISVAEVPSRMLNQAIYPSISHSKNLKELKKYYRLFIILSLLITILVFAFSPLAVEFFTSNNHRDVIIITRILCLYLLFSSLTPFLGTSVLIAFGYEKEFNISVILSSFITISCYALVLLFKIYSVEFFALILCVSELFIFTMRMYYCKINKLL